MAIQFDSSQLIMLNAVLAFMMFGVSLSLKVDDFSRVIRQPIAPAVGLVAQFLLLPAATSFAVWALNIDPALGLGMILVACCPGGTFSNIMAFIGRANVAVSVSMTAVSSVVATVLTPLNFALYGWLNPVTRPLLTTIQIDALNILLLVVLVLAIPLALGMAVGQRFPRLAQRAEQPMRLIGLMILLAFVALAFAGNMDVFMAEGHRFVGLVLGHNALALLLGAVAATLTRLPRGDRRAITLEVGIQNSGLALVILFTFFPEASGMILIAAFWGVWHLISGLTLAVIWSRYPRRLA